MSSVVCVCVCEGDCEPFELLFTHVCLLLSTQGPFNRLHVQINISHPDHEAAPQPPVGDLRPPLISEA